MFWRSVFGDATAGAQNQSTACGTAHGQASDCRLFNPLCRSMQEQHRVNVPADANTQTDFGEYVTEIHHRVDLQAICAAADEAVDKMA